MQAPQANCNFCGVHLVMGEINYTPDGRVACNACNAKVDLFVADQNVGKNVKNAAVYALCAPILAFFVGMFPSLLATGFAILLVVSGLVGGIFALRAFNQRGDERFTQHIQKDKGLVYTCSIIGITISGILLILYTLAIYAILTAPRVVEYQYHGY